MIANITNDRFWEHLHCLAESVSTMNFEKVHGGKHNYWSLLGTLTLSITRNLNNELSDRL